MFVHPTRVYLAARDLIASGASSAEVARTLHLPLGTVRVWRARGSPRHDQLASATPRWRPPDERSYSYLLAMYLGDGHITRCSAHGYFLRLSLDLQYEGIIAEASSAMSVTLPRASIRRYRFDADRNTIVLQLSHPALPFAFPQLGRGAKHTRSIVLRGWQHAITHRYPEAFLRGLIHSDGCRTVNRFSTRLPSGRVANYQYVRYFFSNLSADVRALFCEHCDLLGIRWTQSNHRNISVSHRHSVAKLETIVGPKT